MGLLKKYLSAVLITWFFDIAAVTEGQQASKVSRLGYLSGIGSSPNAEFMEKLRDLGYMDGKNITVEFRTAQKQLNKLPDLAVNLARSSLDALFASDFNSAVASKNATQNIPVVFQTFGDPVVSGLVSSLARPGGNLTGVAGFGPELSGKRLEIIKEVVPGLSRIAVLTDPSNVAGAATLRETEVAAKSLRLTLQVYKVGTADELKNAFTSMRKNRSSALLVNHDPTLTAQREYILGFVRKNFFRFILSAMLFAFCSSIEAQQPGKVFRIGFLDSSTASGVAVLLDVFRQEQTKLGWIEGKNFTIEYRFAEQKSERLPELAAELVRLKVDLIVVTGGTSALAVKEATTTIPIVMANIGDPVAAGLVASLRGVMLPAYRVYRPS